MPQPSAQLCDKEKSKFLCEYNLLLCLLHGMTTLSSSEFRGKNMLAYDEESLSFFIRMTLKSILAFLSVRLHFGGCVSEDEEVLLFSKRVFYVLRLDIIGEDIEFVVACVG